MTALPASAQQADAVAVSAENGVGENGAGENVAAEQSAQTQTPATETLYAEERAYCLQRFEDGRCLVGGREVREKVVKLEDACGRLRTGTHLR